MDLSCAVTNTLLYLSDFFTHCGHYVILSYIDFQVLYMVDGRALRLYTYEDNGY